MFHPPVQTLTVAEIDAHAVLAAGTKAGHCQFVVGVDVEHRQAEGRMAQAVVKQRRAHRHRE